MPRRAVDARYFFFAKRIMKKISVLLLLLWSLGGRAQSSVIPVSYVDSLNEIATSDSLYYFQKIKFAQRALDAARDIDYDRGEFSALQNLGIAHLNLNKYDSALENFFAARKLGEETNNRGFEAYALYYIGNVYNKLNNSEKALENFNLSLDIYTELEDPFWQAVNYNGIGSVYGTAGEGEKALQAFKKCVEIFEENGFAKQASIPIANIGEYYFENEKYELAERYADRALKLAKEFDDKKEIIGAVFLQAQLKEKSKEYENAEQLYLQALALAEEHQYNRDIVFTKKALSDFYEKAGNYKKANILLNEAVTLNDSILTRDLTNEIVKIQASYADEKRDRELAESRAKIATLELESSTQNFLIALAVGALLLLGMTFLYFYSRIKTRRALTEERFKAEAKERELLQQEVESKQRDLTNFALDISRKNDFSEELYEGLKKIAQSAKSETAKAKARELLLSTANHLKINDDIKEFQENVDVVNQDFFNRLTERFPDLTANDRQLCGLIRLNLSTKDIASVRNISPKSVEMGRYRLRKKLNLEQGEDIAVFMQGV